MFYEASRPSYSYRLSFSITAFPFCLLVCLFLPGEGGGFVAIKRLRGGLWLSSRPSSDGGTDSGSPPPPVHPFLRHHPQPNTFSPHLIINWPRTLPPPPQKSISSSAAAAGRLLLTRLKVEGLSVGRAERQDAGERFFFNGCLKNN